jgi:hypothetical protein
VKFVTFPTVEFFVMTTYTLLELRLGRQYE